MSFQSDLKKLGLSDKEAAVYLATLGIGPSPVQPIARRAKVARATTYLVLESLMEKGLVTRFEEGGKTTFVPESPRNLEQLLDKREAEIKREKAELKALLPKLEVFVKVTDDRPVVRYYEGVEGLRAIRSEMTRYSKPGETWYQILPVDYMYSALGKEDSSYVAPRKAKHIQSKTIFTTKSKEVRNQILSTAEQKWVERKFVAPEQYTSGSSLAVVRDVTVLSTFKGKLGGVVVESSSVATLMREMFEIIWKDLA